MATIHISDEYGATKPALVFTRCQWTNMKDNINRGRKEVEEVVKKLQDVERRKELSKEMAKTWDNTYVNMRKRRFEKRKERLKREEEYKDKRFAEIRAGEIRVKEERRQKAKMMLFYDKDATKLYHRAFKTSEAEAERLAQVEFEKKLKVIDEEIEAKYAQSIADDVKKFNKEENDVKLKLQERKIVLKKEAKAMFREAAERKKNEEEERKKKEREDRELTYRQLKQVEENEKLETQRRFEMEKHNLIHNRAMVKERKRIEKLDDEEETEAIQIISNGKMKIAKIRRIKEDQLLTAKLNRHQIIANYIQDEVDQKLQREEESLKQAVAERVQLEIDRKEKEHQYKEMLKKERILDHEVYVKETEEKIKKEKEQLKWSILQRFKKEELDNLFYEKTKDDRRIRELERQIACIKQVECDVTRKMEEKQLDLEAAQRSQDLWENDDREFLTYAEQVREESKAKGRPLFPLDAAIYDFKKRNNLLESNKRNFIWDSKVTRPDGLICMKYNKQDYYLPCGPRKEPKCLEREVCGCGKKAYGV